MAYKTTDIFGAIKGQLERKVGDLIDGVFVYDGNLTTALASHLSQPTGAKMQAFLFIALSDHVPTHLSGSGQPLRSELLVDIYAIVKADGRTRYTTSLERLWGICDTIVQDTFCTDCTSVADGYRDVISATIFESRSRRDVEDGLLAHLIRYRVVPKSI